MAQPQLICKLGNEKPKGPGENISKKKLLEWVDEIQELINLKQISLNVFPKLTF